MGRVVGAFGVVAALALHGVAPASRDCFIIVPEGAVHASGFIYGPIGGGGFDPGEYVAIFIGSGPGAKGIGPANASGSYSIGYSFTASGQYPIKANGSEGNPPCVAEGAILVEGAGPVITFPPLIVTPVPTTTTTLVVSVSDLPAAIPFDPGAQGDPIIELGTVPQTTTPPGTTPPGDTTTQPPEPTGTTAGSATTAAPGTGGSTIVTNGGTIAAFAETPSDGGGSMLLLGTATAVVAVLVGLIAGWLLGKKAMR